MDRSLEIQDLTTPTASQQTDTGPLLTPHYVKAGDDPLGAVEWIQVEVPELENGHKFVVEAPREWSPRSVNIAAHHYLAVCDEKSIRKMIHRVVSTITEWGLKSDVLTTDEADTLYRELAYLLVHRRASFNSPVWYNVGVPGREPLAGACFVNSVEDTMESITDLVALEAKIFKKGAGAGCNWSQLRASTEAVGDAGGKASGPVSFMSTGDHSASRIKSGGRHRRAARMDLLDDDHLDIEQFIDCKVKAERMSRALVAAGWSTDMNDAESIHNVVPYQSTNISVRVHDAFMRAAQDDSDWDLVPRRSGQRVTVKAGELLDKVANAIWECGDPGVQFTDTINSASMIRNVEEIVASNPCSEFAFANNTSCNLASVNMVPVTGPITLRDVRAAARTLILAQDIICDHAAYPSTLIRDRTRAYRPLGLGWSNLGGYVMAHGWAYDSAEARTQVAAITSYLTACAYEQSLDLAQRTRPFAYASKCQDGVHQVFRGHLRAVVKLNHEDGVAAQGVWERVLDRCGAGELPRNAMVTLAAPTGTIGLLMDCETTGIEPYFALRTTKKLSYGGTMTLAAPLVRRALQALGYTDEHIQLVERQVAASGHVDSLVDPLHLPVFDTAMPAVPGGRAIPWQAHIAMLAALQPHLSSAISKTVNMPETATREDIKSALFMAWEQGVKCLSIYRDGSKASQPLTVTGKKEVETGSPLLWGERKRLPQTRPGYSHKFELGGAEFYVHVGLYESGEVGEIFFTSPKQGSTIDGLLNVWSIAVSCALQSGLPLSALIEKYRSTKFEPQGWADGNFYSSLADYVFRWLETMFLSATPPADIVVNDDSGTWQAQTVVGYRDQPGKLTGDVCPQCGSIMRMHGNKCFLCPSCGRNGGGCG